MAAASGDKSILWAACCHDHRPLCTLQHHVSRIRIDVSHGKAGKVTKLSPSRRMVLADAIRPLGKNVFLIVEGGGRLDRMTIKGNTAEIETLKDGFAVPTGVAIAGGMARVSEGQLSFIFNPRMKGQTPRLPFRIYSVAIRSR